MDAHVIFVSKIRRSRIFCSFLHERDGTVDSAVRPTTDRPTTTCNRQSTEDRRMVFRPSEERARKTETKDDRPYVVLLLSASPCPPQQKEGRGGGGEEENQERNRKKEKEREKEEWDEFDHRIVRPPLPLSRRFVTLMRRR